MTLALKAAGLALITALVILCLQVGYALHILESVIDQLGAEGNMVAVSTIKQTAGAGRAVSDVSRGVTDSLDQLTGPTGHLAVTNHLLALAIRGSDEKYGILETTDNISRATTAALFGYRGRRGLLAVTEATANLEDHLTQGVDQVNDAIPLYLDCTSNPDCVFNRYVGTARAIERTAIAIEKTAPEFTASLNQFTASSAHSAKIIDDYLTEISRPKRWWEKAGTVGAVGKAGFIACRVLLNC